MNKIDLKAAQNIKLMNRVEKKYICTLDQLYLIMQQIEHYDIVEDNAKQELKYSSIYFDTDNLTMWNAHNNDDTHRQKIRIREYANGDKFLEIKDKNKEDGITRKSRIPVDSYILDNEINWISKNLIYDTKELNKILTIEYNRITLINKDKLERVTIDQNIHFYNHKNRMHNFLDIIIIEIKQIPNHISELEKVLEELHIEPVKFSKYHKGILMTRGA